MERGHSLPGRPGRSTDRGSRRVPQSFRRCGRARRDRENLADRLHHVEAAIVVCVVVTLASRRPELLRHANARARSRPWFGTQLTRRSTPPYWHGMRRPSRSNSTFAEGAGLRRVQQLINNVSFAPLRASCKPTRAFPACPSCCSVCRSSWCSPVGGVLLCRLRRPRRLIVLQSAAPRNFPKSRNASIPRRAPGNRWLFAFARIPARCKP